LQDLVEALHVEAWPEDRLRPLPSASPRHVPDLVAARLAGLGAIALDFALRARPRETGSGDEIVGRLLAAPAPGVDAGVDDEPGGAEQEGLEIAGAFERRPV